LHRRIAQRRHTQRDTPDRFAPAFSVLPVRNSDDGRAENRADDYHLTQDSWWNDFLTKTLPASQARIGELGLSGDDARIAMIVDNDPSHCAPGEVLAPNAESGTRPVSELTTPMLVAGLVAGRRWASHRADGARFRAM
jgi:hypothetical protein